MLFNRPEDPRAFLLAQLEALKSGEVHLIIITYMTLIASRLVPNNKEKIGYYYITMLNFALCFCQDMLFTDEDLQTMFGMFDIVRKGSITSEQYKQGNLDNSDIHVIN